MRQIALFSRVRALLSISLNSRLWTYLGCLLYFVSENAYAADIQTILNNVSRIIVPLTTMVLIISYMSGVWMMINALTKLKKFGNMSMQAQPGELGGPLIKLAVGAVLIYLPSSTDALTASLFGASDSIFGSSGGVNYRNVGYGSEILGYLPADSFGQQWAAMANTLVLYIQFVGFLSFVKGWFILSKSAGQSGQQGSAGKSFTHILGGIMAINFISMARIINNTIFGI